MFNFLCGNLLMYKIHNSEENTLTLQTEFNPFEHTLKPLQMRQENGKKTVALKAFKNTPYLNIKIDLILYLKFIQKINIRKLFHVGKYQ